MLIVSYLESAYPITPVDPFHGSFFILKQSIFFVFSYFPNYDNIN